jgi:hypothetical protein
MRNYITEHMKKRLIERTGYSIETLIIDIEKNKESELRLTKNSEELKWFPQLKREFIKYPNSMILVYESIGLCLVTSEKNIITIYNL